MINWDSAAAALDPAARSAALRPLQPEYRADLPGLDALVRLLPWPAPSTRHGRPGGRGLPGVARQSARRFGLDPQTGPFCAAVHLQASTAFRRATAMSIYRSRWSDAPARLVSASTSTTSRQRPRASASDPCQVAPIAMSSGAKKHRIAFDSRKATTRSAVRSSRAANETKTDHMPGALSREAFAWARAAGHAAAVPPDRCESARCGTGAEGAIFEVGAAAPEGVH